MGVDGPQLRSLVRDVVDFPQPGVVFKDLTPLLADGPALAAVVEDLAAFGRQVGCDAVVGVEARGFVLAAPVAVALGVGFVPVRKPGKLPWDAVRRSYDLEYGSDALEVHADALVAGHRALVVDDVLATGGTAAATCELVESLGATVAGVAVLVELAFLHGRSRLGDRVLHRVLEYGS
jgi:adenine phosphoribosyltransferase